VQEGSALIIRLAARHEDKRFDRLERLY